jgi:hypothetical protein
MDLRIDDLHGVPRHPLLLQHSRARGAKSGERGLDLDAARSMLSAMPEHRFRSLDRLIRQANQTSSRKPGSVEMLARVIQLVTADGADPYLVIGVLVEGAVHTLAEYIPPERQADATEELGRLLVERLKARGLT